MKIKVILSVLVFASIFLFTCETTPQDKTLLQIDSQLKAEYNKKLQWDFDKLPIGQIPKGWKIEGTRAKKAQTKWQIMTDQTAPSGQQVLGLANIYHNSKSIFNLCWTNKITFLNGSIEVQFKAVKGKVDQGGGLIWRVRDKNNYYIARFNPLEDNLRLYTVHKGIRKMLKNVDIRLNSGWHTLKVVHHGQRIEIYLNAKRRMNVRNNTFAQAGGIGLWTKADAVTSFDDLVLRY